MNVVLVHPYISLRSPDVYLSEPLGLVCLASYLKQSLGDDVQVSVLDLYAMAAHAPQRIGELYYVGIHDAARIGDEIRRRSPDLVGVTCNFTAYAEDSMAVARAIKHAIPEVPVVLGGAHATIEAEAILRQQPSIDYVVRHEGELVLEELIRALRGERDLGSVDGLVFRAPDGTVHKNRQRKLLRSLDVLPMPDRSYLNMNRYAELNREGTWYSRQEPAATIITSRGCPYDCVFCSTKVMWQRRWRPRSLDNVFKEIEHLVSEYGVREIIINDDQFMAKRKRVIEFCDYFIERGLDLSFSYDSGTSTWLADEELLAKMRRAGFYAIRFPVESGNEQTLEFIGKPIKLARVKELIREANRLGYWTSGNFIIGFPYETPAQIQETIRFARDSGLDFVSFLIAKPNAGSELYNIFKKEGLLKGVVHGSHFYRSDYDTKTMSSAELNRIQAEASRDFLIHKLLFYLRPRNMRTHLLPKFRSAEDLRYGARMSRMLLRKKVLPLLSTLAHSALQRPPRKTP